MRKSDAIKYYGGTLSNPDGALSRIAEVLGISRQAVFSWPSVVPPQSAIKLEMATKGDLKVKPELYK